MDRRGRGFEILAPHPLSVVCFRHLPAGLAPSAGALDQHNQRVVDEINRGVLRVSLNDAPQRTPRDSLRDRATRAPRPLTYPTPGTCC
jgi:hypothetical protein